LAGKSAEDKFELNVSQLVIDEVRAGDAQVARQRLELVQDLPLLGRTWP
jgi:hypothetical protein